MYIFRILPSAAIALLLVKLYHFYLKAMISLHQIFMLYFSFAKMLSITSQLHQQFQSSITLTDLHNFFNCLTFCELTTSLFSKILEIRKIGAPLKVLLVIVLIFDVSFNIFPCQRLVADVATCIGIILSRYIITWMRKLHVTREISS